METEWYQSVCVIGLGYIGLPTSTIVASRGVRVTGVDNKPDVVKTVNEGKIHIVEPDLEGLVSKVIADGTLKAVEKPVPADIFMITVPTPIQADTAPDMSYVHKAAELIAPTIQKGNLVILESTSPVGATEEVSRMLAALRPDLTFPHDSGEAADISMAYCPERVLPGHILMELMYNDRIIGGMTPRCAVRAEQFYRLFVRGNCYRTSSAVAELVKLTENAYRDVNIAFANELADICDVHGLDVWDVIKMANCHPRVNILQPGPGVGGHCIPIDPWFIVNGAPEQSRLIAQARQVNDGRPQRVIDAVMAHIPEGETKTVACLGLSYKPNVDDLRESPAMHIAEALAASGRCRMIVAEPNIKTLPQSLTKDHVKFSDALSAIADADVVLVLVSHRAFSYIDKSAMSDKVVLNYTGLWH